MYLARIILSLGVILLVGLLTSCNMDDGISTNVVTQESSTGMVEKLSLTENSSTVTESSLQKKGFMHGLVVDIDGENYYFSGAPDGPGGAFDIPGHYWIQAGPGQLVGKHFNTGPFGAAQWWSSDASDGELLYIVHAIIDTWSMEKAEMYASRGYIHYHEMIAVSDGSFHPTKVVWLKHTARTTFTLDGGPHPELSHEVDPGVDLEFIPNGSMPYSP